MIYAAFLRGVNVGGKGIISMAELKTYFEDLGFDDVITYINSGNVVFSTAKKSPRVLETSITKALAAHFDFEIAVVVRTVNEVASLLDEVANFWPEPRNEKRNVIFLRHGIDKPSILDGLVIKEGIEAVTYVPGALLWSAQSSQLGKSNMIKLSSKSIYKEVTVRTVGTVEKVFTLMEKMVAR